MIPYARQFISDDDVLTVQRTLQSDWLTQGPAIENFEKAVAEFAGAKYAVAVSSATAALHIACLTLDLGPGDILWTTPNTFVASANCALFCGATVDFVDIDPKTYNLCSQTLEIKLKKAKKKNKLPKVVIPVHFSGQPCDMQKIKELSKEYNFFIIEDASHAIGATYLSSRIGNCAFSDIAVFSFHPVKLITTGEGGMALTNNEKLHEKLTLLRSHGITRNPRKMSSKAEEGWYYEQIDLGFNYRITDLQAALGISQLKQLPDFIKRRTKLAQQYHNALQDLPITLPWQHPDGKSAWHLYVIQLENEEIRKKVYNELHSKNIKVNVHYIPVHTQPYYQRLGFKLGDFSQAERYYQCAISLPLFYKLTDEDQAFVIETLKKFFCRNI